MKLIQSFIAIPEKAAKQQLQQLSATSNTEVQQQIEKVFKGKAFRSSTLSGIF